MKYDFDKIISRRNTNCYKYDSAPYDDTIAMWVADMDFQVAPKIIEALRKRVEHGIFGYTRVPDSYYESVIRWFERRHNFRMEKDWFIYVPGVVPAVSAIIKAMTSPGDKVLIQTPVYNCFFSSIRNNGCEAECSSLVYDTSGSQPTYRIDFDDFERRCADPKTKVFLLCNPHNPAGRVWTKEELTKMGEICLRHDVFVIADEIHCELVMPGYEYTPFASLGEDFLMHSATCSSPSKAFNIAGLQISNITAKDESVRQKIDKAVNINEVCDVNPFGVLALQAAYDESEDWLMQLIEYLNENYIALCRFFEEHLPDFPVCKLEGTYLVWVDISKTGTESDILCKEMLAKEHVWLNDGLMYGEEGKNFVRINIALPRARMLEGLQRMEKFLKEK